MALEQQQDYISTTRYTSNVSVGGPGGNPYSLLATWPKTVKRITVYRDQKRIRGIELERHDSAVLHIGVYEDKNPITYTFQENEQLTRILLYSSDYDNGRFAGFKLRTTRQQSVEAFAYGFTPSSSNEVEIPVGNGKWNGIFGKGGGDIDSLGFAMLTGNT